MTRDDLAKMYEKANGWSPASSENTMNDLARFAALVAAHEREACVEIVNDNTDGDGLCCADDLLAAIRARGQA